MRNSFFRQILSLSNSLFVFFNDLMIAVVSYFDINSGSPKREAESAAQIIFRSFFHVSNLHDVTFSSASWKPTKVPDWNTRPAIVTYFIFRFHIFTATVNRCAPTKSLTAEFSLRLVDAKVVSLLVHLCTPTKYDDIKCWYTFKVSRPPRCRAYCTG